MIKGKISQEEIFDDNYNDGGTYMTYTDQDQMIGDPNYHKFTHLINTNANEPLYLDKLPTNLRYLQISNSSCNTESMLGWVIPNLLYLKITKSSVNNSNNFLMEASFPKKNIILEVLDIDFVIDFKIISNLPITLKNLTCRVDKLTCDLKPVCIGDESITLTPINMSHLENLEHLTINYNIASQIILPKSLKILNISNLINPYNKNIKTLYYLSNNLCDFLGLPYGTKIEKGFVNKYINDYINIKKLTTKNRNSNTNYILDNNLLKLINSPNDLINITNIHNLINCHFIKEIKELSYVPNSKQRHSIDDIKHINLNNLMKLPNGLTKFNCQNLNIRVLPDLITNLVELNCSNCNIMELPILPVTLEILDCSNNGMLIFPILSCNLIQFIGDHNDFDTISKIPDTLKKLSINDSYIDDFKDNLSTGIEYLSFSNCNIHKLPNILPKNLTYLDCSDNFIKTLPETLPSNLIYLDCSNNKIKIINYLPKKLKTLLCKNNLQIEIDAKLPRSLDLINVDSKKSMFDKHKNPFD